MLKPLTHEVVKSIIEAEKIRVEKHHAVAKVVRNIIRDKRDGKVVNRRIEKKVAAALDEKFPSSSGWQVWIHDIAGMRYLNCGNRNYFSPCSADGWYTHIFLTYDSNPVLTLPHFDYHNKGLLENAERCIEELRGTLESPGPIDRIVSLFNRYVDSENAVDSYNGTCRYRFMEAIGKSR